MSTKMYRKTSCLACGYSQATILSYYLDRKQWNSIHTAAYCRSRQAHPAIRSKMSVA